MVIAQTVGGDVVVELTGVDDDNFDGGHHVRDLAVREEVAGSTLERSAQNDETTHLRVDTTSSTADIYHTFDSDENIWEVVVTLWSTPRIKQLVYLTKRYRKTTNGDSAHGKRGTSLPTSGYISWILHGRYACNFYLV